MKVERNEIMSVLEVLAESFQKFLFEDDEIFLENMKTKNLAGDDVSRYQHWEWTQGVGLYGLYQMAHELGRNDYVDFLHSFYDKEILSNLKRERKTAPKQTVILKGAFYNLSLSVLLK